MGQGRDRPADQAPRPPDRRPARRLPDHPRARSSSARSRSDPAALVRNAVEAVRPLVEAAEHELDVSIAPGALRLEADPTRLEQILVNLLTNAAKYTEPGGRIELTAGPEGADLVIRVADNGIGIAPEMLPRIFELFAQVERTIDRSQGGLGIGLTLVRKLAEMHGGSVSGRQPGAGAGERVHRPAPA